MNPYEVLGLAIDASADQVKAAYRREAAKAHPDRQGGNAQRMAAVNEAYAVLSDPARRRAFDAGGQTSDKPPIEREAMDLLASLFMKALEQDEIGLVAFAKHHASAALQKLISDRTQALDKVRRMQSKAKKVRTRDGATNLVHSLVNQQVEVLRSKVGALNRLLKVVSCANKMLQAYDEDLPVRVVQQTFVTSTGFGGAGTHVFFGR